MAVDRSNWPRYTLRLSREMLDKLEYIAEYEGRTKSRELEQLVKIKIAEFEKEHGPIDLDEFYHI